MTIRELNKEVSYLKKRDTQNMWQASVLLVNIKYLQKITKESIFCYKKLIFLSSQFTLRPINYINSLNLATLRFNLFDFD